MDCPALEQWTGGWPALIKPEQGGSGARMYLLQSPDELPRLLREQTTLWLPDNLLLLQEYFPVDAEQGIVRMEFLGGKFLYAMRVVTLRTAPYLSRLLRSPSSFIPFPKSRPKPSILGRGSWRRAVLTSAALNIWKQRDG